MFLKITIIALIFISSLAFGKSFDKVMAKNRASKNIGNSNYKVINGNEEYKEQKRKGTIGLNIKDTRVGTVYNYIDIKNVDMGNKKEKRKYGLSKITDEEKKQNLYGVKASKKFRGKIRNTVNIKNSNLH